MLVSPPRNIPRYFEAVRGGRSWANDLPPDVLRAIVQATDDPCPVKFASVCRGWRWLLDDPDMRHTLTLTAPHRPSELVRALRSFSLFVCSRPPETRELLVYALDSPADGPWVAAALAPVLWHLAGVVEGVTLHHPHAAAALVCGPFLDLCQRLEYLHCTARCDLDLGDVGSLRHLELTLDSWGTRHVALPGSLSSLRVRVTEDADPGAVASLLAELPSLTRLKTFRLATGHACEIDVDSLPPRLSTLVLSGDVHIHLVLPTTHTPAIADTLEVLSLDHCRLSALALAALLHRSVSQGSTGLIDVTSLGTDDRRPGSRRAGS